MKSTGPIQSSEERNSTDIAEDPSLPVHRSSPWTIIFGCVGIFGTIIGLIASGPTIYSASKDPESAIIQWRIITAILGGAILGVLIFAVIKPYLKLFKRLNQLQENLEKERNENAERKQFLSLFLQSLPMLFQKTLHVKKNVSSSILNGYREQLRHEDGNLEIKQSYLLDSSDSTVNYISHAVKQLLADLREAILKLTSTQDVLCSIKMAVNGKLISFYEHDPIQDRCDEENHYLKAEELSEPHTIIGKVLNDTTVRCFDCIDDLEVYGEAVVSHRKKEWPNMGNRIQSLALCPVVIEHKKSDLPFAVLQVDSPERNCFKSEHDRTTANLMKVPIEKHNGAIVEMVKCTADAVGAVISVALYVHERFNKTEQLRLEKNRLQSELDSLQVQMDERETDLSDRVDEIRHWQELNQELKQTDERKESIVLDLSGAIETIHDDFTKACEFIESAEFARKSKKDQFTYFQDKLLNAIETSGQSSSFDGIDDEGEN